MTNKKKVALACIVGVLVIIIGISAYGVIRSREEVQEIVDVETYAIPKVENIFVNGTISPMEVESFGMNMSLGSVETVHVKDGDKISVGDTIVTYKRDGVAEQIEGLELQLDAIKKAKSEGEQAPSREGRANSQQQELQALEGLEGLEGLDIDGLDLESMAPDIELAAMDYDTQISSLESQIKKLREMEKSVEKSGIKGIAYIENTTVQEGVSLERVVVRSEEFVAVGTVNEKNVLKLSEGMESEITLLSDDTKIEGEIKQVGQRPSSGGDSGAIDISSAMAGGSAGDSLSSYQVIFNLKSQVKLLEGFSVQARVALEQEDILIPESSIEIDGEEKYVYRVRDGVTERIKIEARLSSEQDEQEEDESLEGVESTDLEKADKSKLEDGKAVVVSGLSQGDEIVISDISSLSGGERVE